MLASYCQPSLRVFFFTFPPPSEKHVLYSLTLTTTRTPVSPKVEWSASLVHVRTSSVGWIDVVPRWEPFRRLGGPTCTRPRPTTTSGAWKETGRVHYLWHKQNKNIQTIQNVCFIKVFSIQSSITKQKCVTDVEKHTTLA